jgi:hypothetical protein
MRNRMTYPQLLGEQQECECDIGKGSTEFHRAEWKITTLNNRRPCRMRRRRATVRRQIISIV